jgi:hypothetical protein
VDWQTPIRIKSFTLIKAGRSLTTTNFAKLLNYPRASNREYKRILRWLEHEGLAVEEQGGYLGDNMHHDKIVTVLKPFDIDRFKKIIITRTNYRIGKWGIHRSEAERKCNKCKGIIAKGERYGSDVGISGRSKGGKSHAFFRDIICLNCLMDAHEYEDLLDLAMTEMVV